MTTHDFRRLALALPEAIESAHMDHPDFRVRGKVFATLGHPAKGWGMVKLHPEQQHYFAKAEPEVFVPVKGAWGRRGATSVNLRAARKISLVRALRAAWRNTAPKRLAEQLPEDV
ncbi:MAG: MmcQ/YjbR family DNA-binding protein [Candidatus Sulfotelmatobacter sp.]